MLDAVTSVPGSESTSKDFCHACFSGDYPISLSQPVRGRQMPLPVVTG